MVFAAFVLGALLFRMLSRRFKAPATTLPEESLSHPFRVTPTGPNGEYTRRDRFRAAAASAFGSCIGFAIASAAQLVNVRLEDRTAAANTAEGVMLAGALIGVVAALAALSHVFMAPFAPKDADNHA